MSPRTPHAEPPEGHFGVRTTLILLLAALSGALTGGLLWLSGEHMASSLAIALGATGAAFFGWDRVIHKPSQQTGMHDARSK
ncbi:hypothetical protein [Nocardiopsis alba]|uniref:hypothetical protein n=1 Tax=Nocardiopsis alba TaxID=53437 RepID=UPI001267AE92|nr:hypothetical protein [Nocardiopsis alba]